MNVHLERKNSLNLGACFVENFRDSLFYFLSRLRRARTFAEVS